MCKVVVLMSVYNPNILFLEQQVQSIVNQKHGTDLIIRVDGVPNQKLRRYLDRIVIECKNVQVIFGDNIGVQASFLKLLKTAQGDYDLYAFSDQDDIFTLDKISRAVELIDVSNIPQLYCSRLVYVDQNNTKLGTSKDFYKTKFDFKNILAENYIGGNCMVLNASLCNLVLLSYGATPIMHDWWILLLASAFGKIVYDSKPCVLYRQHEMNLIGGTSSIAEYYINKIKNYSFKQPKNTIYSQSKQLSQYYMPMLDAEKQQVLNLFLESKASFLNRLKYIFSKDKIKRSMCIDDLILNILILINKY